MIVEKKLKNFKDLTIWQEGMEIAEDIYNIKKNFSKDEVYGLTSQIRRASISVPSNIAEGFLRSNKKEFRRFLFIALGSSAEMETQIILSSRMGYVNTSSLTEITDKIHLLNKRIRTLIKKL